MAGAFGRWSISQFLLNLSAKVLKSVLFYVILLINSNEFMKKSSKIGDVVRAEAEVTKVDGKIIELKVAAYSGETRLGEGTHRRFFVDREKSMSRIG